MRDSATTAPPAGTDPESALNNDSDSPSTSPRCGRGAAAAAAAARGHNRQLSRRRAAAAAAASARPLASALALGLSIGLLAGSAWHMGRSQAQRLSATSSSSSALDLAAATPTPPPTTTTTPATAAAPTPALPPFPPPPAIPTGEKGDTIHVVFTSNGSPYGNFQGRLHYASFLRARRSGAGGGGGGGGGEQTPSPASKLVAFTRLLHRSADDALVREIPTFRADPLEPACDTWCEFPVKDRAHAVKQWLLAAADEGGGGSKPPLIKAPWILMLETDYVWRYPIAAPGDASDRGVRSQAFLFDYMAPEAPEVAPFVRAMCGGLCHPSQVLATGPAPVLLRRSELEAAVDDWVRLSAWIEANKEAREALGWIREMFAWAVAAARAGLRFDAAAPPKSPLALQPPHDALPPIPTGGGVDGGGADSSSSGSNDGGPVAAAVQPALFHYTWGAIFHEGTKDGPEVWRFDKRDYTSGADAERPPALPLPPAWREGLVLQDGVPVTRALRDTLAEMVGLMNAAGAELLAIGGGSSSSSQGPAGAT